MCDKSWLAGLAMLGTLGFMAYCTYDKVSGWVCPPKPKGLCYEVRQGRIIFTTENGRLEYLLQNEPARTHYEEIILHAEVANRGPLMPENIYAICRSMDNDTDRTITVREAEQYRNAAIK